MKTKNVLNTRNVRLAFQLHYIYAVRCGLKASLSKQDGYWNVEIVK